MISITDPETGEITEYTQQEFEAKRNETINEWDKYNTALNSFKKKESALRKELVKLCFNSANQKGTEYHELANGWRLKAVKKINYGWIKSGKETDTMALEKALVAIENLSEAGKLVAQRLVKWKPELSLSQYDLLSQQEADIINKIIVTALGSATLELIPPSK